MKKHFGATFLIVLSFYVQLYAQKQLDDSYDIIWATQSKNASESMPCGGGDIGMNVWVENGDLLIYVARSGSLNEDNNLMKAGRLRIKCNPNPFNGKVFRQELHLQNGYVTVDGENNGVKASVKIWVDVFHPVAHIEIAASKKIEVDAAYESWRYQDRLITKRENFSNSWKWGPPADKKYTRDSIDFWENGVRFFHNNGPATIFDTTVSQQGLNSVKEQMYNPLKNLVFGGHFWGKNFVPAVVYNGKYEATDFKGWKLKSRQTSTKQELFLALYNEQYNETTNELVSPLWITKSAILRLLPQDKDAFSKTQQWWKEFWNRSFITIDGSNVSSKSWEVGRNYQLFRYMLGCNAKGFWPTKFNGGLLTVDPLYTDAGNKGLTPDYRNWGGGLHTAQNQRLVYFPMIRSGDWDMMQSQFNFYLRILKNAELRSKVYWDHSGACFTEQMENYGLPNYAEYGLNRPADFDKGVEYNAWLEYEWDTVLEFCLMMLEENSYTGKDITSKISFIESCLLFFDEHYQYLAKKRGIKALDGDGKLVLYPGSGAETFKMANNSTATIAALQTITRKLLSLPGQLIADEQRNRLENQLKRIPGISFTHFGHHITIAPAKTWERVNNTESTQLYPVFPWGIFGIGKPGLDTALNTWEYDTLVKKFRSHVGWKQDNIWAARLGLTAEAWRLTSLKLQNSERRFPAFWGPGFDWVPDHNWGGSGMIGLQEMLMQTDDKRILLFPAWPKDKDVHFKLHAPYNTTVEAEWKSGKLEMLKVFPEERRKDVEMMLK
ncbi:MAG: hypothetical protein JNK14_01925 [Chitinophagaceae bacterium]|nr:hypothetical protein [Chitinophagaceae bacterium]